MNKINSVATQRLEIETNLAIMLLFLATYYAIYVCCSVHRFYLCMCYAQYYAQLSDLCLKLYK